MLARFFRETGSVLLRNPIYFFYFSGGPDPLSPPLNPRMWYLLKHVICILVLYLSTFADVQTYNKGFYANIFNSRVGLLAVLSNRPQVSVNHDFIKGFMDDK